MSRYADLRAYYEYEASQQRRGPLTGRRVDFRQRFIAMLRDEERTSVVDFGAGPGRDGAAFAASDIRFVGVDLAHGNGVLARADGLTVVQGSIDAPPFRPQSFDAGWSMSTLMHLPETAVVPTLAAMTATLGVGAPLAIGLWGGPSGTVIDTDDAGHRRPFYSRSLDANAALIATCGAIEHSATWNIDDVEAPYHLFIVRVS